jgi:predicted metal-binding protein
MLSRYDFALVVQITLKVPEGNYEEVFTTAKNDFTDLIIKLEKSAFQKGFPLAAGLSAGHCAVCPDCALKAGGKPCLHPERARPSMEALGMDVGRVCSLLSLPAEFIAGEVTLTGILLID